MRDFQKIINERQIKKVVHFHTDHFEPNTTEASIHQLSEIETFSRLCQQYPHAKKSSLFTTFNMHRCVNEKFKKADYVYKLPNDVITFYNSLKYFSFLDNSLQLLHANGHDIQIHIHHEHWTKNLQKIDNDGIKLALLNSPVTDSQRLEFYLKMQLTFFRKALNLPFNEWYFIHGCWALNASDLNICTLSDEIQILHRNGCRGDFTFPSSRAHCNPFITSPYTVKPYNHIVSYKLDIAEPKIIGQDTNIITPDRFLIWNNNHEDYTVICLDRLWQSAYDNWPIDKTVYFWFLKSFVVNNTLFIKTFSHSLMTELYWKDLKNPTFPLIHPKVIQTFQKLEEICNNLKIELQYATTTEVVNQLKNYDNTTK